MYLACYDSSDAAYNLNISQWYSSFNQTVDWTNRRAVEFKNLHRILIVSDLTLPRPHTPSKKYG